MVALIAKLTYNFIGQSIIWFIVVYTVSQSCQISSILANQKLPNVEYKSLESYFIICTNGVGRPLRTLVPKYSLSHLGFFLIATLVTILIGVFVFRYLFPSIGQTWKRAEIFQHNFRPVSLAKRLRIMEKLYLRRLKRWKNNFPQKLFQRFHDQLFLSFFVNYYT